MKDQSKNGMSFIGLKAVLRPGQYVAAGALQHFIDLTHAGLGMVFRRRKLVSVFCYTVREQMPAYTSVYQSEWAAIIHASMQGNEDALNMINLSSFVFYIETLCKHLCSDRSVTVSLLNYDS